MERIKEDVHNLFNHVERLAIYVLLDGIVLFILVQLFCLVLYHERIHIGFYKIYEKQEVIHGSITNVRSQIKQRNSQDNENFRQSRRMCTIRYP